VARKRRSNPSSSALDASGDTFLQLVGVPRPSPAKAQQFLDIDLVGTRIDRGGQRR